MVRLSSSSSPPPPRLRWSRLLVGGALAVVAAALWWRAAAIGAVDAPTPGPAAAASPGSAAGGQAEGPSGPDVGADRHAVPDSGRIERPAVATLAGRIVHAGEPAAGVELFASPKSGYPDRRARASTGADGRFALELEPGIYRVLLAGGGIPHGWELERLYVQAARALDLGDLAVPRGVRVRGRVVDEAGLAIAGASVRAHVGDDGFRREVGEHGAPADPVVATDERGRFEFDALVAGEVRLQVEHAEYSSTTATGDAAGRSELVFADLALRPAAPLRGVVLDEAGRPVAGVEVAPGGGRTEPRRRERAVTSGPDGGFELRGFGRRRSLTLLATGYAPTVAEVRAERQPVQVRLPAATPLVGRVIGAEGRQGRFRIAKPTDDYRRLSWVESRHLYRWHALGDDGSIRLDHLHAGGWTIEVRVAGLGTVAPRRFEMPLAAPLELEPVPYVTVDVEVVDEQDRPVPAARLWRVASDNPGLYAELSPAQRARRWAGFGTQERLVADDRGRAELAVPQHEPLMLGAGAPLHGMASAMHAVGETPARVRLALPRHGVVRGVVAEAAAVTRHVNLYVRFERADGAVTDGAGSAFVDAHGRFASEELQPGPYRAQVVVVDAASSTLRAMPVAEPIPVLHDYEVVAGPVPVDVVAGAEVEVALPAPMLAEVAGRVVAAGLPVAGALVYGVAVDDDGRFGRPDELDAHRYHPHVRTGADGRYRFLVASSKAFELRARRATAPAWSPPTPMQVRPGERAVRDLSLPASAITGRYDVAPIPLADRRFFEAQLYPAARAAEDPFVMAHYAVSLDFEVQRQVVGRDGAFAFEGLQPGTWVLRLVGRHDEIVAQRVLTVAGDERRTLGLVDPPVRVAPALRCGLGGRHGVWVRRVVDGVPDGLFVATVTNFAPGRPWRWPELEPGRYRLATFVVSDNTWGIGTLGKAAGAVVDVTVHVDGTCTPAAVWPDGL